MAAKIFILILLIFQLLLLILAAIACFITTILGILFIISEMYSSLPDAPFIPSFKKAKDKMIEFSEIKPGEKVVDLGCGDGRLVFAASDKGANAIGVEITIFVYWYAKILQFVFKKKGKLIRGNLYDHDIRDADVLFCYLMPRQLNKIDKKFKEECKKGCRIICNSFKLPGWEIEKSYDTNPSKRRGTIYKYIV